MIPSTQVTKADGNTGTTRPAPDGICAIIAPGTGTANQVSTAASPKAALSQQGYTPLADFASFMINKTQNSVVMVPPTCSVSATYNNVTLTGTGTSVPSGDGSVLPLDDFSAKGPDGVGVIIVIVVGGTVGMAGITYKYTLDGGQSYSAIQALGTATSIVIPNTGIKIDLTHSSNTLVAGDTITFTTTCARASDADISTALEALRTANVAYEGILIFGVTDATLVGTLDTWLTAREGEGKFKFFAGNTRHMNSGESESAYLTAMTSAYATAASIRGLVAADSANLPSSLPGVGWVMERDAALLVTTRAMGQDISQDPAYVALGPIGGAIYDSTGAQIHHDEAQFPGLDDQRLTALRSLEGFPGVYVNNANLISPGGSDYVFLQHARVMNKACSLAWQILTAQLSIGVKAAPNAQIGAGEYITEDDAQRIEALVNDELDAQLTRPKKVSGAAFVLSRTDDLSSNSGATLSGDVRISALRYVKKFKLNAFFVKTVTAAAA
jgi:hypothetical protein